MNTENNKDDLYANSSTERMLGSESHNNIVNLLKILGETTHDVEYLLKTTQTFYDTQTRHKYSEIALYLYELSDNNTCIENIRQNIDKLLHCIKNREDCKELSKKLIKLQDHITLEGLRISCINELVSELDRQTKILQADVSRTENEIRDSKKQYITILGIFASIVLAFVAGLSFSSSVLAHIHKASIYRLIFVMAFIALFVGNMILLLLNFLQDISSKNDTDKSKLTNFNIICLTIMFIDGLIWSVKTLCKF